MGQDNNSNEEEKSENLLVIRSPQWDDDRYDEAVIVAEKLARPICGARKRNGGICTQRPDASAGNGRCRFHGARAGRKMKHGIYSKRLTKTINRDIFEEFLGDPELYELDAEIALLRTLLTDYINRCEKLSSDTNQTADQVQQVATTCVRIIQAIARLQTCRDRLDKTDYIKYTVVDMEIKRRERAFFTAARTFLSNDEQFQQLLNIYTHARQDAKAFNELNADFDLAEVLENAAYRLRRKHY